MVKLKVVGEQKGKRILPVIYNDNYLNLMPGEEKIIRMEVRDEDTLGEKPAIQYEGLNVIN